MTEPGPQRRNKSFEATHADLLLTAVQLLSEGGVEALTISGLARAAKVNRTTVYYHFESREALVAAVKSWAAQQIVTGFRPDVSQRERIDSVTRFVLANPDLVKLWIEDFVSGSDIRDSYPFWDALVEGLRAHFARTPGEEDADVEVFCTILLTSAIIGPRVFANGVAPGERIDTIVERFRAEHQRLLRHEALLRL
ncbi:TetR/AcrR family transcriptional regulator [Stakelama tenebrarum]|uniref:TetR/AcrR family transcriptional regulator n=1 Tax=Stakelama tenebrarum TaxID=2711215 RepID=A0A6G6Y8J8_9SPHN|nr:TetR/AcrR family transcriptional regulator [Sphingosinithalassobacter tenebrarum]QIG81038.1 TetR/AcrR family transcriptional regulator [Sphingosinithalassobacter tenebrarum]